MRDSASSDCYGDVRAKARRQFLSRLGRQLALFAGITLLCCGCYGAYDIWREHHLERQAENFAARGDAASVVLVARHLLQLHPDNLVALRVMAELAERSERAEAIDWRLAIARVQPRVAENQFALAAAALRFGQIDLAGRALNSIPPALHETPRYHQLAGATALALHHNEKAEEHFAAALEQEPGNTQTALNLAMLRLASNKPAIVTGARANLRRLLKNPNARMPALRALAGDALAYRDGPDALQWTKLLVAGQAATFEDHLLYLEATRGTEVAAAALARCAALAANSPALTAHLITWMNRHEMAEMARSWSATLPDKIRATQPVPLAIAESISCARDWPALAEFVRAQNWREQESLRLAIQSHASRHLSGENDTALEAQSSWRAALKAAQNRPDQLTTIARLAEGWGYPDEASAAWWLIANGNVKVKEALLALQNLYEKTHDSRGLLRVAKRALELNPEDLVAANNCASLGLLLNGDSASHRLAEKLHTEHPTNAAFAATYAFALHTEGKTADALRVIEKLKETQLRQPALAAYYVVMLAESGNFDRARAYLPAAARAVLLPEEQALLASAIHKLS